MSDEKRTIKIRTLEGIVECSTWIEGPFGVHQQYLESGLFSLNYSVTHLPSGMSMGPLFERSNDAMAFARSIIPLRDWTAFTPADITERLRAQVRRAYETNHGFKVDLDNERLVHKRAIEEFAADLNGDVLLEFTNASEAGDG